MAVALAEPDLLEQVEWLRVETGRRTLPDHKTVLGQFFTPAPVAQRMASMLGMPSDSVSILDAGCGIGSLFAACVALLCQREQRPRHIRVTAYEVDPELQDGLQRVVQLCHAACDQAGIGFDAEVHACDFVQSAAHSRISPTIYAGCGSSLRWGHG